MLKRIIKKVIPSPLLGFYHFSLAFFAAVKYRFPSQKVKVIGVIGTNGKSTTVEMIAEIFKTAGFKTASLSSIRFQINSLEEQNKFKMTMPGRFFVQQFLRKAVDAGCKFAVVEVTSEGIKQHRHRFIDFDAAVFTNLSPEHIEAHKGFENYRKAKSGLFQATKNIHIINLDDENADYFLKFPAIKKYGYAVLKDKISENIELIKARNIEVLPNGSKFLIDNTEFKLELLGEFNIYNALAAICAGLSQEISLEICKKALEKVEGIPGRMEEVIPFPFKVFVDYAFTPNALEKVYQSLVANYKQPAAKLVCVLGACGGGRDKWKRPVLGNIAQKYCDKIIVTNEDPYDEDPMDIIEQVARGAGNKAEKILDRRQAIREALISAKTGDVVVITGKGCEPWIMIERGKKIPWDDRKVVKEESQGIKP